MRCSPSLKNRLVTVAPLLSRSSQIRLPHQTKVLTLAAAPSGRNVTRTC